MLALGSGWEATIGELLRDDEEEPDEDEDLRVSDGSCCASRTERSEVASRWEEGKVRERWLLRGPDRLGGDGRMGGGVASDCLVDHCTVWDTERRKGGCCGSTWLSGWGEEETV